MTESFLILSKHAQWPTLQFAKIKLQTLFYPIIMQSIFLFLLHLCLHTVSIGIFAVLIIILVVAGLCYEGTTNNFLYVFKVMSRFCGILWQKILKRV